MVPPYDSAISDAIQRGDARKLQALVKQAKLLYDRQGDLAGAIRRGEAALKKLGGSKATTGGKGTKGTKGKK